MKFGLKLVHSGPGATPDLILRWTRFAEAVGFHLLMTADHIAMTPEVQEQYPAPYYEAFTVLSWLAGVTERIELGTTVIVLPHRDPIYTAQLAANVDQFSGGRLILGVGVGWAESEFDALGLPFRRRGAMSDDYLSAMQALWTSEFASHDGEFTSFNDVELSPKPARLPHPPIWVGGNSTPAIRRAVRFGDAWHPIGIRTDEIRDSGLPALRQMADAEGKQMPAFCPRILCNITDSPLPEDERLAGEGSVDQVRRDIADLEELGAEYVVLDTKRQSATEGAERHHDTAWPMVTTLAEQVIDIENGTLR